MSTGLPNDLDFTLKKAAPRGVRQFRNALSPIGGIASSGLTGSDILKYDIATGRSGQYIDTTQSYLSIKVKAGATGAITLDGSAYALFQRLTVLSGGQILEDINEYGNFVNLQIDAGVGPASRQTAANIMLGCATAGDNAINITRQGVTIAQGTTVTFTLPLVSGILGAQGNTKYLPVGAIQNDLRLEIQLATLQNACVNTTAAATGWSITEANFMLSYIELDSEVQKMIDASTGGNYYISSETWRNYSNSINKGSTGDTILIPARFASVKGIVHTFRPAASQNSYLNAGISNRVNPLFHATNACSVQYTIGPSLYPNSPIRSSAEAFAELQRYYHNLANSNISGSINATNYNVALDVDPDGLATGASDAQVLVYFGALGSGLFGINLDSVSNRSDVMMSGLNTLNSNIILNMTYATPIGAANGETGVKFDSYVHIDCVLAIEAGVLSVRV